MHSFIVLYIFATALVLVQSELYHPEKHDEHSFKIIEDCFHDEVRSKILLHMSQTKPLERDTLVPLNPPTGYVFDPSVVIVKRCGGRCLYPKSPMPMKTENVTFVVKLQEKGKSNNDQCVEVKVAEHNGCRCGCLNRSTTSNPHKEWNSYNCAYMCRNTIDKDLCSKMLEMEWDEANCECRCTTNIMTCPSGYTWNRKYCECMPS